MMAFFWRRIEPLVQAVITDRILMFHKALVERGQLSPASPAGPVTELHG